MEPPINTQEEGGFTASWEIHMKKLSLASVSYSETIASRNSTKGTLLMDDLVQRLSERDHPVTVGGPKPSLDALRRGVEDMGYVLIKFTDTRGGTDLGLWIDTSATDLSQAHFDQGTGIAHIEGTLTLNFVNVRCIADIELKTLNGTGHIVVEG
jgi:hypothetical protein